MAGYSGTPLVNKPGIKACCTVLLLAGLLGCSESPRPDLKRLYQLGTPDTEAAAPVILIPGAFGTRLRDRLSGEEIWPGPWWRILFSSYPELALDIDPATNAPRPSRLEASGIAEQALRRDFYRPILQTLTQFGGYARAQPGTPARKGERRYYVLSYDWRQDTLHSVRELDRLIEAVRRDYADPALRVDVVAHSMGGLIARYYLRYGTREVLDGAPQQVTMEGGTGCANWCCWARPTWGRSAHCTPSSGAKRSCGAVFRRARWPPFPAATSCFRTRSTTGWWILRASLATTTCSTPKPGSAWLGRSTSPAWPALPMRRRCSAISFTSWSVHAVWHGCCLWPSRCRRSATCSLAAAAT
ncbi:hypothetical protein LP417_14480 [Polaromonas sp. P1-6]|nr:hypothetical protein LP417_14480 [Polaromonas sp. P1-6]